MIFKRIFFCYCPSAMHVIGDNIRKHRQIKGLSVDGLARQSGFASNYLGALERGAGDSYKNPKIGTLIAIAKALKIPLYELLRGVAEEDSGDGLVDAPPANETPPKIPEGYVKLDEHALAFFKLWDIMPNESRKTLFSLAEQIVGKGKRPSKLPASGRAKT